MVDGARQIGKTYIIRKFLEENSNSFVEFNLYDNLVKEAFETADGAKDLLLKISVLSNKPLIKGETIIFIDEVKSGKDYKRHVALDNLLSDSEHNIKKAYILSKGNVEVVNNRIYIPIYMIMFIEKKVTENNIISLDFSALKQKNINN